MICCFCWLLCVCVCVSLSSGGEHLEMLLFMASRQSGEKTPYNDANFTIPCYTIQYTYCMYKYMHNTISNLENPHLPQHMRWIERANVDDNRGSGTGDDNDDGGGWSECEKSADHIIGSHTRISLYTPHICTAPDKYNDTVRVYVVIVEVWKSGEWKWPK